MFVDIYADELETFQKDMDIAADCENIEFRKKMEIRYPTMCSDAQQHLRRWVLLHSLDKVGEATYLCGYSSCADIFNVSLTRSIVIIIISLLLVLFLFWRWRVAQYERMMIHRMGMDTYQMYAPEVSHLCKIKNV